MNIKIKNINWNSLISGIAWLIMLICYAIWGNMREIFELSKNNTDIIYSMAGLMIHLMWILAIMMIIIGIAGKHSSGEIN